MCVICSLYLKDLSQHLYLPGRVNIMIYHQFLEICYSILFDQEAEKTQKLHVSVGKFPLLNKTFGVEFGNIFCKRCFIIITLTIEEEKDLRHCD